MKTTDELVLTGLTSPGYWNVCWQSQSSFEFSIQINNAVDFCLKNILKITENKNYGMDLIITKVVTIKLIKLFNLIVNYKNVSPLLFGMI